MKITDELLIALVSVTMILVSCTISWLNLNDEPITLLVGISTFFIIMTLLFSLFKEKSKNG